jgi:chromosome segregation ATPase
MVHTTFLQSIIVIGKSRGDSFLLFIKQCHNQKTDAQQLKLIPHSIQFNSNGDHYTEYLISILSSYLTNYTTAGTTLLQYSKMDTDLQGYLDWGSSVNVNEDLTRAIKQEIQDLNQDLRNLSHSIQTEEKTAAQVQRDYSHSLSELTLFVRSAADEKDNGAMNEQIQMKLGESLQNEIVTVISQKTDSTSLTENKENVSPEDGMTEYIIKRARDVKKLTAIIHASQERIGACQVRLEEAEFELRNANDSFNREQKNHKRWKSEVEDARKEHANEERRVKGIRDSLARRRKNAAEYTNQTTACVSPFVQSLHGEFCHFLLTIQFRFF